MDVLTVSRVDVFEHEVDIPLRCAIGVAKALIVAQRTDRGQRAQVEFPFPEFGHLEHILQARRQFELILDGVMHLGDVARNCQQVADLAVAAEDRGDQHVPPLRGALRGRAKGIEVSFAAAQRELHSRHDLGARGSGPQVRPQFAVQCGEVVDLHRALAIAVHRPQATVHVHDLNAVGTLLERPVHVDGAAGNGVVVGGGA